MRHIWRFLLFIKLKLLIYKSNVAQDKDDGFQ